MYLMICNTSYNTSHVAPINNKFNTFSQGFTSQLKTTTFCIEFSTKSPARESDESEGLNNKF